MPPTRAKSPKLGRRKSCSGPVSSSQGDEVKGTHHKNRCSLGSQREAIIATTFSSANKKNQNNVQNGKALLLIQRQAQEMSELVPPEANGHTGLDINFLS